MSSMIHASPLLRRALGVDAAVGGATVALQLLLGGPLADLLELPPSLITATGWFVLAFTGLLIVLLRARAMPTALVVTVIAINTAWTVASIALALSSMVQPNVLGTVFLAINALWTGILAVVEWRGLARSTPSGAAMAI